MGDDLDAAWLRLGWIDEDAEREDAERDLRRENPSSADEPENFGPPIFDPWPGEVGSLEDTAELARDPRWRPYGERWLAEEGDETW